MQQSPPVEDSVVLVEGVHGHGSGAIVGPNRVLTAGHVAEMPALSVETLDGDRYAVLEAIFDPDSDAAILVIDGTFEERPLMLDSSALKRRDRVEVIGAPLLTEFFGTVLPGQVVNVDRELVAGGETYTNLDMLDAHATSGCSGGPVLHNGRIAGVCVVYTPMAWVSHSLPCEEFLEDLGL
jgi:S1-C subfamily serine protease